MNPTYCQVFSFSLAGISSRFSPSFLSVCAFEIAGVWVISGPSAVAGVCLFFYKYFFERKKLVPVTFSQRMSQVTCEDVSSEYMLYPLFPLV